MAPAKDGFAIGDLPQGRAEKDEVECLWGNDGLRGISDDPSEIV